MKAFKCVLLTLSLIILIPNLVFGDMFKEYNDCIDTQEPNSVPMSYLSKSAKIILAESSIIKDKIDAMAKLSMLSTNSNVKEIRKFLGIPTDTAFKIAQIRQDMAGVENLTLASSQDKNGIWPCSHILNNAYGLDGQKLSQEDALKAWEEQRLQAMKSLKRLNESQKKITTIGKTPWENNMGTMPLDGLGKGFDKPNETSEPFNPRSRGLMEQIFTPENGERSEWDKGMPGPINNGNGYPPYDLDSRGIR